MFQKKKKNVSKRKKKKNRKEDEKGPGILMLLEHGDEDKWQSMYLIQPTLVDGRSEIKPLFTFPVKDKFRIGCECVSLGRNVYFIGGINSDLNDDVADVGVLDTDRPDLGLKWVSPMHTPKLGPYVFATDGMVYALGYPPYKATKTYPALGGGFATGCFERYDPGSNTWQVLRDPPCFIDGRVFKLNPTFVGSRVFIGPSCLIFNLDSLDWDLLPPPPSLARRFPCGSLCVDGSLYYLHGEYISMYNYGDDDDDYDDEPGQPLRLLKRGPLPSFSPDTNSLLESPCFDPGMQQIAAPPPDLAQPPIFYTGIYCPPSRLLFHMGGRFFCYIVTQHLIDLKHPNQVESPDLHFRGFWIKFFEEVEVKVKVPSEPSFRTLASFFYKTNTPWINSVLRLRCCVVGSIPQSWIKNPPGNVTPQIDAKSLEVEAVRKDAFNWVTENGNLRELRAVQEEEIRRMGAELSKKNEILNNIQDMIGSSVN